MNAMRVNLAWAALLPLLAACGSDGESSLSLGKDRYQVEVDPLFHDEEMTLIRLAVEARGKRILTLTAGGRDQAVTVEPEPNAASDQVTFEVTCVGSLVRPSQGDWHLTWMTRIRGGGTSAGGPLRLSVKPASKAEKIFRLDPKAGEYSLGESITLGDLRGSAVTLKVE